MLQLLCKLLLFNLEKLLLFLLIEHALLFGELIDILKTVNVHNAEVIIFTSDLMMVMARWFFDAINVHNNHKVSGLCSVPITQFLSGTNLKTSNFVFAHPILYQ